MKFRLVEADGSHELARLLSDISGNKYSPRGLISILRKKYKNIDSILINYAKDTDTDIEDIHAHHINGIHKTQVNDPCNSPDNIALVTREVHERITDEYRKFIINKFSEVICQDYSKKLNAKIADVVATCIPEGIPISSIFRISTSKYKQFVKNLPTELTRYFMDELRYKYQVIVLSDALASQLSEV